MATKSLTIIVPVNFAGLANNFLEAAGYGPDNLSIPLRTAGASYATHVGCHWWATDAEIADIRQKLIDAGAPAAVVDAYLLAAEAGEDIYIRNVKAKKDAEGLLDIDTETFINPPRMTSDIVRVQGKDWQSLIDFNVYDPTGGFKWVQV